MLSSVMICIRSSKAAGIELLPTFDQPIVGLGRPVAEHSIRAVVPALTVTSNGFWEK